MSLLMKTFKFAEDLIFECYILIINTNNNVIEFWFKGGDVAKFLEYSSPRQAISKYIPIQWKKNWNDLMASSIGYSTGNVIQKPSNWHPSTLFISEPGLYALVSRSKKLEALKFQRWLYEEVLSSLRCMNKFNTDQIESQSILEQISMCERERKELLEKNNKLQTELLTTRLKYQNEFLRLKYDDARLSLLDHRGTTKLSEVNRQLNAYVQEINRLKDMCNLLRTYASNAAIDMARNGLLAKHNIEENDMLRDCLKNLVDRVVPKSDPLKEHYNVCYMYINKGITYYKIIRGQLMTIKKYEGQMPGFGCIKRARTHDDWLSTATEISRIKSPNPVSFWTSVLQQFPEVFYGVKFVNGFAKTNFYYLTEEEIRMRYQKDFKALNSIRQEKGKLQMTHLSEFENFVFIDEDDAVSRCFTAENNRREKTVFMLESIRDKIQNEILPQINAVRDATIYTDSNINNYIKNKIVAGIKPTLIITRFNN